MAWFIDGFVWYRSYANDSPHWCDFVGHFLVASQTAIPSASLCIARRIYWPSEKHLRGVRRIKIYREYVIDWLLGLFLPLLQIILQYIVQERRYYILEDLGCILLSSNVLLTYIIVMIPPLVFSAFSLGFCFGRNIDKVDAPTPIVYHSLLNRSTRLLILTALESVIAFTLGIYNIVSNASVEMGVFVSPQDTHANITQVESYSTEAWVQLPSASYLQLSRWTSVWSCLFAFLFLGFEREMLLPYIALCSRASATCHSGLAMLHSVRTRSTRASEPSRATSSSTELRTLPCISEPKYSQSWVSEGPEFLFIHPDRPLPDLPVHRP
ncbi:STE3-domain-containing protein [Fistulina hepatica ATCC 64428]|uniref:STE3-domain-containing protein n=1 Tax=Fistulina hepatica ATCC 64428 TaxID=1128425 RepID=A0A0D7AIK6_9AGAR|nr:STE3-domain-containing protein [Fistulina hepatica ATCC 64428]